MASVRITGIPKETHAVLLQRAALAHQSLEGYLLGLLVREAGTPTIDEVLDRADHRTDGALSSSQAVQAVRDDRDGR